MNQDSDEEGKKLIKYTGNYGYNTLNSQFWDDFEDFGEEGLIANKITKIKIYTRNFEHKQAISGISCEFKNICNGKVKTKEHIGSLNFDDAKEFVLKNNEYLTTFHIRINEKSECVTQLRFETNKGNKILVGIEEGEDKIILSNGARNIFIGTFGCTNEKLDAMGCLYLSKEEYIGRRLFYLFMLRYILKKDNKFREKWDANLNALPYEFKYIWKTVHLPDAVFSQIIGYCYY